VVAPGPLWGWGAEGHRIAVEGAIRALPQPLRSYYTAQLPFLLAHASDPDDWSLIDPQEAHRHYLDLELLGPDPLADLPGTYEEAVARYGLELLNDAGTLPWTVVRFCQRLSEAEAGGEWEHAALLSAALAHYTADACMPMHTTVNYKGQRTGNLILPGRTEHRHVHVRFEVAMVRQFEEPVRRQVCNTARPAAVTNDPLGFVSALLIRSHARVEFLLEADREVVTAFGFQEGRAGADDFTPEFYQALYECTGDLAAEQLATAASATASLWLSAWEAAGRPEPPAKRVAFGDQVAMVERGHLGGPEHRVTKVFVKDGLPFAISWADWPRAGRSAAGRSLSKKEYEELWNSLNSLGVWNLADAGSAKADAGPVISVTVARDGREHAFTVQAPETRKERAYGDVCRAIRTLAPTLRAPETKTPAAPAPEEEASP